MNDKIHIPEIGAEMLLNYLYPEMEQRWIAHDEGTFYRNYNDDTLSVDAATGNVALARDGFLKLLPQGYISPEDELRTKDRQGKHKEIERRKRILADAFLPLDSFAFRRNLKIDSEVSRILNGKFELILRDYFGFDPRKESDTYVRLFSRLLPSARRMRGALGALRNLLSAVFKCKVNLVIGRMSDTDSTKEWIPAVRYEVIMENLDNKDFNRMKEGIDELTGFIQEWFIPAEAYFQILVKDPHSPSIIGGNLTLDYNTNIL